MPDQWKEEVVFPLLRFDKCLTNLNSYRPIAFTNNSCKVLDTMINYRLMKYLEMNNALVNYQSGFRDRHSALDALCSLENSIRQCL